MAERYEQMSDDDFLDLLMRRGAPAKCVDGPASGPDTTKALAARGSTVQPDRPVSPEESREQRSLFPAVAVGITRYRPLDSVWYGEEDAELVEKLLAFYPRREPKLILDAAVNGGRFWRGSARAVIGLDVEARHRPDICADNRAMPFASSSFDVVVYDPPHIPNQGRDRSKDFNIRFGLGARSTKEHKYTFAHTYPAFMREAWRILINEGILLCKIADYVHNHRYQWAHIDLICAGQDVGFTACDCIIKVRKGPIVDPKWKVAHHSRRQHCYWIIFRKSPHCE